MYLDSRTPGSSDVRLSNYIGVNPQKERLYMGTEFIVSGDYEGYVYVGNARGNIVDEQKGEKRPYYQMFVLSPVSTYHSEDYEASGFKAEKKKCLSADVWKDLEPGSRVKLFFDDKGRVVMAALDQ